MKPIDLYRLRQIRQTAQQKEALKIAEDKKNQPKSHKLNWEQGFDLILKILKASLVYWLEKHAMQGLSFALYHGRCQFVLLRYKSEPYKTKISQKEYLQKLYSKGVRSFGYDENYSPNDEVEVEVIPPPFSSQYGTGEIILKYHAPLETSYPDITAEIYKDISKYRSHFPVGNDFEEIKPAFSSQFEKICFIPVVKFMQSPAGNEFIEFVHQQGLIFRTEQNSSHKDDIDFIVSFE